MVSQINQFLIRFNNTLSNSLAIAGSNEIPRYFFSVVLLPTGILIKSYNKAPFHTLRDILS